MLVMTDPQTGIVSVTLSSSDRKKLAAARTVVERMAYHLRDDPDGPGLQQLSEALGDILNPPTPATAVSPPKAKADA